MMPINPRRCVSALAIAGTTAALVLVGTGAAQASSVHYVSFGDSYASGVGAGSYSSAGGSCDQSANSYSVLWANANAPASFTNATCSGATTSSIESDYLSDLSSSTTLVSITVGGDDVGFTSVMETCVLEGTSACESAVSSAESEVESELPAKLDTLYADIKADAPNAHVVATGYPEFYDLSKSGSCIGLSTASRTAIDGGADALDGVIQTAAQKYGFTYVDIRPYFSNHEICDSNSYLNSVDIFDLDSSYHPTASGQSDAYYPALKAGVAQ
jgi:GDSL-like Lipase/Acylhydrolase family